jgi:hypothetical protein
MFETHSFSELTDVFAFKMGGLVFEVGSVGEMAGVNDTETRRNGKWETSTYLAWACWLPAPFLSHLPHLPSPPTESLT